MTHAAAAFDDDPPPRRLKPSGAMARLPDGAQTRHRAATVAPLAGLDRRRKGPGYRRRLRRDTLIAAAHRKLGFPQRWLAEVFGLPHSRIGAIVREMEATSCR